MLNATFLALLVATPTVARGAPEDSEEVTCSCDDDPTCFCDTAVDEDSDVRVAADPDSDFGDGDEEDVPDWTISQTLTAGAFPRAGLLINAFGITYNGFSDLRVGTVYRVIADEIANVHHFVDLTSSLELGDWTLDADASASPLATIAHEAVRNGDLRRDHVGTWLAGGRLALGCAWATESELGFSVGLGAGANHYGVSYQREHSVSLQDGSFTQLAFDADVAIVRRPFMLVLTTEVNHYTTNVADIRQLPLRGAFVAMAGVAGAPPSWLVGANLEMAVPPWILGVGLLHEAYVDGQGAEIGMLHAKKTLNATWSVTFGATLQIDQPQPGAGWIFQTLGTMGAEWSGS